MRTHTLLTKVASLAVCFGVMFSNPVMAGGNSIIKDVELSKDGTLYGQVYTPAGTKVANAIVQLRYQGTAIAAAKSNTAGQFAIGNVRGGAHEVVIGTLSSPVRLWSAGSAPNNATKGIAVKADETIVRGQDPYCEPCDACPPGVGTSGFGMLDVITLATVGTAAGALIVGIDNNSKLKDIEAALPASP